MNRAELKTLNQNVLLLCVVDFAEFHGFYAAMAASNCWKMMGILAFFGSLL